MKNMQIVFTKRDTAELLTVDTVKPKDDEIMFQTAFSTISNGTEIANITGEANVSIKSLPSNNSVKFPRYSGYSSSGIVVDKGKNVTDFDIGDKVAASWSFHKLFNTVNAQNVIKLDNDAVSLREASMFHISSFPIAAVRKTHLEIGESMLIVGCGILGLLAIQFAHAAGAFPVIAADPNAERRKIALSVGADFVFDPIDERFAEKVKDVSSGGVNTAIEVTGQGKGLDEALDCMAKFGRIALLGCTRNSDFSIDYYHKVHGPGISLIGAHSDARPEFESSPGNFTVHDDVLSVWKLCIGKRIDLSKIPFEIYSPKECFNVYQKLIENKISAPLIQFDWHDLQSKL